MSDKRQRIINYRVAKFEIHRKEDLFSNYSTALPSASLEQLLYDAVKRLVEQNIPLERADLQYGYIETFSVRRGEMLRKNGCGVGALFTYRNGDLVAAKKTDTFGTHIVSAQPISAQGENLPPANNIVYFAVLENHIAYISEYSNAENRLTDFFTWLLKKSNILPFNAYLVLESKISRSARESIRKHGISKICLNVNAKAYSPPGGLKDKIKQAIINIFSNSCEPIIHDLSAPITQEKSLESCTFAISITPGTKNRGIKEQALEYYCCSLSDELLEELSIELKGGNSIRQGELITKGSVELEYMKGVPSEQSVHMELSRWLKEFNDK